MDKKKERQVGLVMAAIISTGMGLLVSALLLLTNEQITKVQSAGMVFLFNTGLSLVFGLIVSQIVPLGKWGFALARKCNANPPSLKFNLINAIPLSFGNTFIISTILSLIGVFTARAHIPPEQLAHMPPFHIMWLGSWGKLLLPTLVLSYLMSITFAPIITRAIGVGGPPKK